MSSAGAPPPEEFRVPAAGDGERLDRVVHERLPALSRTEAGRLIRSGLVLLDGRPRPPGHRCRAGQPVRVVLAERRRAPGEQDPLGPEPVAFEVLHEDEAIVVLDKPAGLVVHPGPGHPGGTLANGLVHRYPELAEVGPPGRPGLVHRLDRGTSGVLVAARTELARLRLAAAFAAREVEKHYLGIVLGTLSAARRLAEPIGRDPREPQRFRVRGRNARDAESEVWPLEALPLSTLVRIRLHTGRTHQARVHLAGAGFPLAGDAFYGPAAPRRGGGQAGAALRRLGRPALHAAAIAFAHPATGAPVRFETPPPADFEGTLAALRAATG